MSTTTSSPITIAAPPTLADVATDMIAWMAAQSGQQTDFNIGSQYRTNAEATGSVADMQGIITQALAFQALVYSAFAAFNVFPFPAVPAVGVVTFLTGTDMSPPPSVQDIIISAGTIVSTVGGTQFQTTATVTLLTGTTSIDAPIQASVPGLNGNVAASSITQIVTGLPAPLFLTNSLPTLEGSDAETPAQTLARFTGIVGALGLSTPVAIANAVIGVTASGSAETVRYSTVYEPWITAVSGTAEFDVFVDNGAGSASVGLLNAVRVKLNGDRALGLDGYRPAGVPYTVQAVTPVPSTVVVSGVAILSSQDAALEAAAVAAIGSYYAALQFGDPAELTQIIAVVANSVAFSLTSLQVWLLDGSNVSRQVITPLVYQRMALTAPIVVFT